MAPITYGEENGRKKLSLNECKTVLNAEGNKYTDEQILMIRDYLYKLAAIEIEHFKSLREDGKLNGVK
jgi:hypothetical protein